MHRGDNPVFLHYRNHEDKSQVVRVHPSFYVNYAPELDHKLKEVLVSPKHLAWQIGDQLETADGQVSLAN